MTKMMVTQVTFLAEGAIVAGEPEGDSTKVILVAAPPEVALPLAMALAAGLHPVVEPPEDDVIDVLEKPKG